MLPQDFLTRMKQMLKDDYEAFLDSYNAPKYQALRVNPLKAKKECFLANNAFTLRSVPWESNGFYYADTDTPGKHPYHAAGVYYIQEPSAMAPAAYLDAKPGETILDLCAAPGGKSTQIAASMQQEGLLISNEIHPARAKILSENIERMGIRNCVVTNESPQSLAKIFIRFFDRIMVDAPCSGEGMFRKNEDACDEWSTENVALCADRQFDILSSAATMLKPGGRMVYSTCTFAPEENEKTIARFLKAHPDFTVLPCKLYEGMSPAVRDWARTGDADVPDGIEHGIRLFPHKLQGEGHFLCVLQKTDQTNLSFLGTCTNGFEAGIPEKDCKEYLDFCRDTLQSKLTGTYLQFGEQLYLAPASLPKLKGLKVLRPGLHLGTLKKNRFEPSHALALTLTAQDVLHTLDYSAESSEIKAYLNGQTLPAEGDKGWYLVTTDGYSIGWGKLAAGMLKNHYPKGLRTMY